MSLLAIQDHTCLLAPPDWAEPVECRRVWRVDVATAASGREERALRRTVPHWELVWTVTLRGPEAMGAQMAALRAALRSGQAGVPCWGQGRRITSQTGRTWLLDTDTWAWVTAEDWLVAMAADGSWTLAQVDLPSPPNQLLLVEEPSGNWVGATVWPVLLGRLRLQALEHPAPELARVRLQFEEHPRRVPVPLMAPAPPPFSGTGGWDNFEAYPLGGNLYWPGGGGWDGPWQVNEAFVLYTGRDSFATAPLGPVVTGSLATGEGWAGGWYVLEMPRAEGRDDFEAYDAGEWIWRNEGSGWDGPWALYETGT